MQLHLGSARKQYRSTLKRSKQKHEVLRFSSRPETPRSHVLNFRATSGPNVLYMRKEMSRFRLPSSARRRLLLKVPNNSKKTSFKFLSLSFFTLPLYSCFIHFSHPISYILPFPRQQFHSLKAIEWQPKASVMIFLSKERFHYQRMFLNMSWNKNSCKVPNPILLRKPSPFL